MTVAGHLDKLDRNLSPGDEKYNRALCAMAAKVAYENKAFISTTVTKDWEMDFIRFYKFFNSYYTEAYMFMDNKNKDNEVVVVAFRGTEPFDGYAWSTDLDISWYEYPGMGKVHGGFMKALGLLENGSWPKEIHRNKERGSAYYKIRRKLRKLLLNNKKRKFIVTGHSLGGALAILFIAILAFHDEKSLLKKLKGFIHLDNPGLETKISEDIVEILTGKMEKAPDETSPKFLSFIGNFDKRVELDSTIKYGDPKYLPALSMVAYKASYENQAYIQTVVTDHWKVSL
ncbi:hypothetical protein FEM48_Zijuj08G0117300 [Ziziphus jujuba var. spinosa]|uniref:Fungal lipase-type domain-containing protein n=1 Tax=Ziziphus jujuba var. spinosa TaxID=714518 RepID=A0A978UYW7_ZIZJJ|nr:hypothetical protein FEM48_Zijuj08G0117300 [Ziziphus jujuba var. spinosa]